MGIKAKKYNDTWILEIRENLGYNNHRELRNDLAILLEIKAKHGDLVQMLNSKDHVKENMAEIKAVAKELAKELEKIADKEE